MQIERLVQMVFYIVRHEHVTAKELADFFHVSTRTVYRDINTLTIAGIPILSAKGTGGGISLMDGYAIFNQRTIRFHYYNSEFRKSERLIEPLRLTFKSHAWYIVGFCRLREEIRTFRLSRMRHIQVLTKVFERKLPADIPLISECREKSDIPVLKLRFSPEIVHRLYDEFQENQVCLRNDGNYYVTVPYELNNWTVHYLLSFGKYVEIVEPQTVRETFREKVSEILALY